MIEHPPSSIAFRGLMAAVCLALLAGCLPPRHNSPAATEPQLPAPPANFTATPGNAVITLTWTASTGATAYNVKRATTDGGPYTLLAQLAAATSNGYTDSSVTNGTAYYYVVSSLNAAGESANSAQASATPQAPNVPPAAPTNLVAAPGDTQVSLTWSASSGATSYNVKRSGTSGGPYTQIAASTSTAYTDTALTDGTTYYYVVSALNAAGESANSAQASATPMAPGVVPAAPTNLTATPGDTQVSLTWSASSGATSYNVKRSGTSGGPYTQIAASTSTSFTDTALTNGTTYYYVVSAVNSTGESANSAQVVAVPGVSNPPPPTFGTWINVTPAGVDLTDNLCGNDGTQSVAVDPSNPSNLYAQFNCQGIWKSTDYGATWTGPINRGANAAAVSDCVGGITVLSSGKNVMGGNGASTKDGDGPPTPTMYQGCIAGSGEGFWKSVDGGVNWTKHFVAPGLIRQDYYAPLVDPYDGNHLIMAGHEQDSIVESVDGGQAWTAVPLDIGMLTNGRTGFVFFINTGNAATTRGTWLWIGEQNGGLNGTWRTANGGATWVQVDMNEHPLGAAQIYQPDSSGVVFMAGSNSIAGQGVLRSADYGQTWTHVGLTNNESVVIGTSKNVYAMFGFPAGPGGTFDSSFELAAQPGDGTWVAPGTPAGLTQGAAQISGVNDGNNNILVGAMWNSGLWRYIEP